MARSDVSNSAGINQPGTPVLGVAISLSGVRPAGMDSRQLLNWAGTLGAIGVRGVQLDGTLGGLRARDLDRSGRHDLAASLRRMEMTLSGIDLFIPPRHFLEAGTVDRAMEALLGAIGLAADLRGVAGAAGPVVAVELPADLAVDVVTQIEAAAARDGVRIADHRWPIAAGGEVIGIGFDPAAVIAAGADVFDTLTGMKTPPLQARLSDWGSAGRVAAGSRAGRLDLVEYAAALAVLGYRSAMVVDVRGVVDPQGAASKVIEGWGRAQMGR